MAEHGEPITDARQYIFTEEVSWRHFSTTQATPTARQRWQDRNHAARLSRLGTTLGEWL